LRGDVRFEFRGPARPHASPKRPVDREASAADFSVSDVFMLTKRDECHPGVEAPAPDAQRRMQRSNPPWPGCFDEQAAAPPEPRGGFGGRTALRSPPAHRGRSLQEGRTVPRCTSSPMRVTAGGRHARRSQAADTTTQFRPWILAA
jgi:hypothetical protein